MSKISNCLAYANQVLCEEWHDKKNGDLTPFDVSLHSNKLAWWKCRKNPAHEWPARIYNRMNGTGCPFCDKKKITYEDSLASVNASLAKEWHPSLNLPLQPSGVAPFSHKKVWWVCKDNPNHEWIASVAKRSNGSDCPLCSHSISKLQMRIFAEIHSVFPTALLETDLRSFGIVNKRLQCDIFIPEVMVVVEVDGPHHEGNEARDANKDKALRGISIDTIRLRDRRLRPIGENNISFVTGNEFEAVCNILTTIKKLRQLSEVTCERIYTYLQSGGFSNNSEYIDLVKGKGKPSEGESLEEKFPVVAKEWHPEFNGRLTTSDVHAYSSQYAWWQCPKEPHHVWSSIISSRTSRKSGCPFCSNRRVSSDNCLANRNFELTKEWYYPLNIELTPYDVTLKSKRRVWWICENNHIWESTVANRASGSGCPHCPPHSTYLCY